MINSEVSAIARAPPYVSVTPERRHRGALVSTAMLTSTALKRMRRREDMRR